MNRNDRFDTIIRELMLISEEIKKNWKSEAADMFCRAFDDSVEYIRKTTENYHDSDDAKKDSAKSQLSDFSF